MVLSGNRASVIDTCLSLRAAAMIADAETSRGPRDENREKSMTLRAAAVQALQEKRRV